MKKIFFAITLIAMLSFRSEDWRTLYSSREVTIRLKAAECLLDNAFKQRWFLLDLKNQTSNKINVQWDLELFDEKGKCVTCNVPNGEYHYSLTIDPLQSKTGECKLSCPPELRVVSKVLDAKTSMSYPEMNITNVQVTTVK